MVSKEENKAVLLAKWSGAAECLAPQETWGFLRIAEKAVFSSEVGSPRPSGAAVPGMEGGRGKGSVFRGLVSHRWIQYLGAGIGSSVNLMSQEEAG